MSDQAASNTGNNRPTSAAGRFTKGDPRINRKGRPKSFDALRRLAQQIACEVITDPDLDTPVIAPSPRKVIAQWETQP